ncbi:D-alanine--D-alanine ligase [bacterium endosymbiont of Pedicinus badii]|uniref:D-alanine--D-alanine ligase n=1 Tax=bacterium endosymbiont of Pedicinus badii TaxID=1719126 RepID=UPI0009B9A587|nr:D-alanine--D-alanine ligase [bacterium endosymbiont of Pedicinus badii]OQM34330.1 hypothetical protein AOQ89_00325 [bacterium endosymbiont of Pedicinus badii]
MYTKFSKKNILFLVGGTSKEHRVSLYSSQDVLKNVDKKNFNIFLFAINKKGEWIQYENYKKYLKNEKHINKISLIRKKKNLAIFPGKQKKKFFNFSKKIWLPKIDLAFPIIYGSEGENGNLQGFLESLYIKYLGSRVYSSSICINKRVTKGIIKRENISIVPFIFIKKDSIIPKFDFLKKVFGIPFVIKPVDQGSSIGVEKIFKEKKFFKSLSKIFSISKEVLIEKYIFGKEIEVGIIKIGNKFCISSYGEIDTKKFFYNFYKKYIKSSTNNLIIPACLEEKTKKLIKKYSIKIFTKLKCSHMARISFLLDKKNKVFFNEINTVPGMGKKSIFYRLWKEKQISYNSLIKKLIFLGLQK